MLLFHFPFSAVHFSFLPSTIITTRIPSVTHSLSPKHRAPASKQSKSLIYRIQNTTAAFQMSNILMLKYVYPWQANCFSVALWPRQSLNLLWSLDQGADSRKSDGWQRQPLALAEQAPLYHPSITLTAKEILYKFIYRALSRQKAEHISHQLKG